MQEPESVREADGVTVAQPFSAGSKNVRESRSPCSGRLMIRLADRYDFSRPFHGLWVSTFANPALKCWAIFKRPLRGLIRAFSTVRSAD